VKVCNIFSEMQPMQPYKSISPTSKALHHQTQKNHDALKEH
jgi:hypothetical protein